MVKSLISRSLKGLKSRGGGWLLGERTEGTDEFSRKFGGLKAGKSEFIGSKVLNFLENLRESLGQTDRNYEPKSDFSALKRREKSLEKGRKVPVKVVSSSWNVCSTSKNNGSKPRNIDSTS